MDLKAEKQALRRQMRERVRTLSQGDAASAGSAAATRILATREFERAPVVALYAALAGEVDTRPLFEAALAAGKRVCAPRCRDDSRLEFAIFTDWEQLRPARFGVLEPAADASVLELAAGDLVIVPGLAFDSHGGRLGRGAGYYDRAFPVGASAAPTLFGLAFSFQVLAQLPRGCHDRGMDAVCTERMLMRGSPTQGEP